jgi:tellurite resistance protein
VASLDAPLTMLREIAGQACDDLDAYSRYIGRHPDGAGTAAALALLPPGIARPADAATQALLAWADDRLGASDRVQVAVSELLARWSVASPESRPGKPGAALLARVLEGHGIGLEPDVRFGGAALAAQAPAVLFRRAAEVVTAPSAGYAAAATLMQFGAAVASADGRVAAAEQDFLERRVVAAGGLAEDERLRLRAHLMRTLAVPPTPAALRKRASVLPDSERRSAGELLVALAASDGGIAPPETDVLARLFRLLGLERSEAYSQVHAAGDETLTHLRTAGAPAAGYSIPAQPRPATATATSRSAGEVVLDPELIKARLAESARAASYLAEVFTDDDTSTLAAVPSGNGMAAIPAGQTADLDARHRALLGRLAARPSWTREDFGRMAADLGLLPGGALEALNEAAFEAVGEPVCEGSDPIDINSYAAEEMLT